jgi:hypothetical protein
MSELFANISIQQIDARRWNLMQRALFRLQEENGTLLDMGLIKVEEKDSKLVFSYSEKNRIKPLTTDVVVDNIPIGASPIYSCDGGGICPEVYQPWSTDGRMIKASVTNSKFVIPLFKNNYMVFGQISKIIENYKKAKAPLDSLILCIRGDEIGLAFKGSLSKFLLMQRTTSTSRFSGKRTMKKKK